MKINSPFAIAGQISKNDAETRLANAQALENEGRGQYYSARAREYEPPATTPEQINMLEQMIKGSPEGSMQNIWARNALASLVYTGQMPGGATIGRRASGQSAPSAGVEGSAGFDTQAMQGGAIIPNEASAYRGAHQFSIQNPDGTTTSYLGPTNASLTNVENRTMSHGEVVGLYDVWQKGIMPYVGRKGAITLAKDQSDSLAGTATKEQIARLSAYEQSNRIRPELAKAIDRFATGGETSVEGTKAIMESALSPHWTQDADVVRQSISDYLKNQTEAFKNSIQPMIQNFPEQATSTPVYINPGFGNKIPTIEQISQNYFDQKNKGSKNVSSANQEKINQINAYAQKAIDRGVNPQKVEALKQQLIANLGK